MSVKTEKVLVLLPVVGDPRHSIRIGMLREAGFEVKALAFERGYDGGAGHTPECEVKVLGRIENRHYLKRVWRMSRVLPTVRREIDWADRVYVFGPDMACMALVSRIGQSLELVTEIADIRRIQVSGGVVGALVRKMDRWVVNRSSLMVITAKGIDSWYFKQQLGLNPFTLQLENKLRPQADAGKDIESSQQSRKAPDPDKLRIGYFGLLRCQWSLSMLRVLAETLPEKVQIKIAGVNLGDEDDMKQISSLPNVEFLGPYNSPDDLPELYSGVDLVWACYPGPEGSPDWRQAQLLCRSNRFYQSCCYGRPLISLAGSGDAEIIAQYDIGLILSNTDTRHLVDSVANLDAEQLAAWERNSRLIPRDVYEFSDEAARLRSALIHRTADCSPGRT